MTFIIDYRINIISCHVEATPSGLNIQEAAKIRSEILVNILKVHEYIAKTSGTIKTMMLQIIYLNRLGYDII